MKMSAIGRYLITILFIASLAVLSPACGGGGTSLGSGGNGGSGGSDGGGSGGDGGDDSGGGAGGGGSSGFGVSGKLASIQVQTSIGAGKQDGASGTVSHVMAVSPETGNRGCTVKEVASDGTFEIDITSGKPSILVFIDQALEGLGMLMGRFLTSDSDLDTLIPIAQTGTAELGTVTIDAESKTATSDQPQADILSDLGLASADAEVLGSLDDIASRYSNPDVDGDGEMDCSQTDHNFILDFHVRYNFLVGGANAEVDDIAGAYFSDSSTTFSYTGTGVYAAYPAAFSSLEAGSFKALDSSITTEEAGAVSANTPTSAVTANSSSSYKGFGVNTTSSSELPSGRIVFTVGGKGLTFSNVATPSLAEIRSSNNRIFIFIRLDKSDSGCTSNCTLSGISYKWMKKISGGWTPASLSEIGMLVADDTAYFSFRIGGDSSKVVGFRIPNSAAEGTITWDAANANLEGATAAEFNSVTTEQICHIGLSYDDQLGMRYFGGIQNSDEGCSS